MPPIDRSRSVATLPAAIEALNHASPSQSRERMDSPYELDNEAVGRDALSGVLRKSVFFDGVFKGSYSLAIVNRHLAQALLELGLDVVCHTPESDWQTDPALDMAPAVKARMRESYPAKDSFDIHLRNTWPPATRDMVGRFNAFVCFAWEEAELPPHLVERFNRDLNLIMVTSYFVRDAFRQSGVTVAIEVVGNGCDHVLAVEPVFSAAPPPEGHARILHISSGFPRKGPDALIAAFRRAFRRGDRVELVLKTFTNPDNVIQKIIDGLSDGDSEDLPAIRIIEADQTYEELVGLMATASMIVAPSRGEGFGLPLAEAMMLSIPVVTTNYSGQLDFCRPDTAWLVDYTLAPSRAHVAGAYSVWADPSIEHLAEQMQAVLERSDQARHRAQRAKDLLEAHFTWSQVAMRVARGLARTQESARSRVDRRAWRMDLVTSWQQRCGIATYAQHLYGTPTLAPTLASIFARRTLDDALENPLDRVPAAADPRVSRIWGFDLAALMRLAKSLERGRADVLWMQHHPGHFSNADMEILAGTLRHSPYRVRAITLHNVREAQRAGSLRWILAFDIVFVHSAEDAAVLSELGHRNVVVAPHGFLPAAGVAPAPVFLPLPLPLPLPATFTVGSFGFLNPHKNVEGLIVAFAQAHRFDKRLRLRILNCVQPNDSSRLARSIIEGLIDHFDLGNSISTRFDFIPEDDLIGELAKCDLLAFPYGPSNETATGAARIAMSVDRPILCSRSSVLRDLWPFSHVLRDTGADCLSEALLSLAQNRELLTLYDHERRQMVDWYSYARIAEKCAFHIEKFMSETHDHSHAA